ncbi:MAG: aldo/keto reductase [Thermoplasmata archaeon]|nr:aldo/keto reductase [Thermoplasmata archaeon]
MPKSIGIDTRVKLNNGVEMPLFGFGTFDIGKGLGAEEATLAALEAGYRLIDTARYYGNEKEIGSAVRKSGIRRDEIFVTTKLRNSDHGFDAAIAAFGGSLKRLGLSYIDLYLIHWPVEGLRNESWRALEAIMKDGKCRAIGVSNYMIWHLEDLLASSSTVPMVNQVEFNPYLFQKDLLEFCRSRDIQFESYCPLTQGAKLGDPRLKAIAKTYSKTTAQVLIRWALQRGVIVIPKSSRKERILENADVFDFEISPEDMRTLDSFNEDLHMSWDPSTAP